MVIQRKWAHHHGRFNIDEDAMAMGAELYAQYAFEYLKTHFKRKSVTSCFMRTRSYFMKNRPVKTDKSSHNDRSFGIIKIV